MAADTRWWRFIRKEMAAREMGVTAFATFAAVKRTKVTAWQAGSTPQADAIKQLAPRLGKSVPELLIETGQFTADDFRLRHLPADPSVLEVDQLLDELRRRLLAREQPAVAPDDDADDMSSASQADDVFPRRVSRGRVDADGPPPAADPVSGDSGQGQNGP